MFCTQCGARNLETDPYCRACNTPLIRRTPSGPAPPVAPPQPDANYPPYPGYQGFPVSQGAPAPYPVQQGASGRAIAAMILSVISFFTCGPLFSIPGLILGKQELNAIRAGQAPPAGEVLAKIAYYAGIVATVLSCLGGIAWLVAVFFGVITGSIH